ncbi:MAG: hypothetical protein AAF907_01225, partial [Planctomycetota bacterium]
ALMGDRYIRFAPDGRRLGPVPAGIRGDEVQVTNRWRFRPDGDRWTLHQDSVDLVRENGKGGRWERRIERRPDGEYFGIALNFAVFPDSELLVTDDEGAYIYDANGKPLRTVAIPSGYTTSVAAGATWIAATYEGAVYLTPRAGGPLQRFAPIRRPGDAEKPFYQLLTDPKGEELWVRDHESGRIDRYAFP